MVAENVKTPVIEVKDVSFSYGEHPVLADVNLSIDHGDFVAFIGSNGGGKTTLVKLMLGILAPDTGSVTIFGSRPPASPGRVGYVPQHITAQAALPVTVSDVVLMGRLGRRQAPRRLTSEDRDAAMDAIRLMGLTDQAGELFGALSGGQRQRVYIARALASDPEILFLDEPTASVDALGQSALYDILSDLNKRMTIIVISHDFGVVSSAVRSVACINHHVHYHDTPTITPEMLSEAYHCPVDLIAHGGVPHRVFAPHDHSHDTDPGHGSE